MLAVLGTAGFLSLASTRVCDAMLPALAQAFATSTAEAAASIYAYAMAYGAMLLVYGPLGDRYGKLRVIALATAFSAVGTTLAALAPTLGTLVIARAAMGAGTAGIVPLALAWIGDSVPLAQRQQAMARFAGLIVLGFIVGPLLGGFLAQEVSWRAAFVVLALLFGGMAVVLLRRGAAARPTGAPPGPRPPYLRQVGAVVARPWSRLVLLAAFIEGAAGIGCLAFVPTVLYTRFGLPLLQGGTLVALFGVGGFLFSRVSAPLLGRMRPSTVPGLAGVLLAIAYGLLAAMPHWGWGAAACVLAGFGFFMLHTTLQVQATQMAAGATGLAMSLFSCSVFIGQSTGVAVGAWTFTRFAPAWSFVGAALVLLAVGFIVMLRLRARQALPGGIH